MSPLNRFKLIFVAWMALALGLTLLSSSWKFFGSTEAAGLALIGGAYLCAEGTDRLITYIKNRGDKPWQELPPK